MNEKKPTLDKQRGERGVVLVISLFLVLALFILGTTYIGLASTETQIASNEISSTKAFSLAEAGIDLAKQKLRNATSWTAVIRDTQPFDCPDLGLAAGDGCSYTIEDDDDGDADPTTDTNKIVVISATGNYRSGEREIQIAFTLPPFVGGPGAVNFVGVDSRLDFSGSTNEVDGNNWVPPSEDRSVLGVLDNNACGPGSGPQFAISTPTEAQKVNLKDETNSSYWPTLTGDVPSPVWSPPSPVPSIGAVPGYLSFSDVEALGDSLLAIADRTFTPGVTIDDEVLGTQSNPMIHAVDCTGYSGLCLRLDGTTKGVGFLIVKNGQALLRATASWIGVIIVYGSNVKFDTGGGGGPGNIIYGTVLIAEDTAAVDKQFRPRNTKTRYSCDAIAMANEAAGWNSSSKDVLWWKEVY